MVPALDAALAWLLGSFDPEVGLVACNGSLWVDTLRRGNYTLDTNSFLTHTLRRLAEAPHTPNPNINTQPSLTPCIRPRFGGISMVRLTRRQRAMTRSRARSAPH